MTSFAERNIFVIVKKYFVAMCAKFQFCACEEINPYMKEYTTYWKVFKIGKRTRYLYELTQLCI